MRRGISAGFAVALLMAGTGQAEGQTNGFVLQCTSARAAAQGCVTRGQEGIPGTLFRDPAGILGQDRAVLGVDVAPFAPTLHYENAANEETRAARHVYPLPAVSYVAARRGSWAWGVGVEPIGGFGADFALRHDLLSGAAGSAVDYESFFAAAKAGAVVAVELTPGLGIGAGLSAVYARIDEFRMPFSMPASAARGLAPLSGLDPAYPALFSQFDELTAYGDSEGYEGVGWAADIGVAYRSPALSVGVSLSPQTTIALDGGRAVIDLSAQFGQMMGALIGTRMMAYGETESDAQATIAGQLTAAGLDLSTGVAATYDAATEITLPLTVGAGFSAAAGPRWTVSGEVEWRRWSAAERTMPFELTSGDNANVNMMVNADPAVASFYYPFPLQWRDTFTGKVGATYAMGGGHVLRAGYLYGGNPVPETTVFVTFPAITTSAVTAGGTVNLGRLPLDLALAYAPPREVIGAADGHLVAREYGASRTRMSEVVLTIGTVVAF